MEALARMFGAKKGEPPSPQMAIQKLRETEEMLNKKSEFLEKKIEQETAIVKKNGMKNKRGIYTRIDIMCIIRHRSVFIHKYLYVHDMYMSL